LTFCHSRAIEVKHRLPDGKIKPGRHLTGPNNASQVSKSSALRKLISPENKKNA
jgi:hypothetical protein